jgi:hypothetical protein
VGNVAHWPSVAHAGPGNGAMGGDIRHSPGWALVKGPRWGLD